MKSARESSSAWKFFLCSVIGAVLLTGFPQWTAAQTAKDARDDDYARHVIEISFGAAHLDIDDGFRTRKLSTGGESRRYPVTSALFLFEWLAFDRISFATMLNIPLGPRKVVEGDKVEEKSVATSAGIGIAGVPLRIAAFRKACLELQAGIMGCTTVNSTSSEGNYPFPLGFMRLRIVTIDGFTLYLGASYAIRKDSIALLYGVGHRF